MSYSSKNVKDAFRSQLGYVKPLWSEVPDALAGIVEALAHRLNLEQVRDVRCLNASGKSPISYLCINEYFIKVYSKRQFRKELISLDIASYVFKSMYNCNVIFEKLNVDEKDYYAVLFPFIESKDYTYSAAFGCSLIEQLARLHNVLSLYHDSKRVQRYSGAKYERLLRQGKKIVNSGICLGEHSLAIRSDIEGMISVFELIKNASDKQVIHGDLNIHNVIFSDRDTYFVDYEEAAISWLPPKFDVAKLYERFILTDDSLGLDVKKHAAGQLLDAHKVNPVCGGASNVSFMDILTWYRGISWLALLRARIPLTSECDEVKKFIHLHKIAHLNAYWLRQL